MPWSELIGEPARAEGISPSSGDPDATAPASARSTGSATSGRATTRSEGNFDGDRELGLKP